MNENDNSRSMLDMLTHEQRAELFAWADEQRPALGGAIDLMKWPGWIAHFRARLAALAAKDSEAQAVNEIARTWRDTPEGGLLAEYGIDVQGTPEAVAELGRIVGHLPIAEALVQIAQFGRKYGVRLFMSARFDERAFVNDAARFQMTEQQARYFVHNLNRYPLPAQDDLGPCPPILDEYWRFGMHATTVTQHLADLQRAYREAGPRGPGDHDGD